MGQITKSLASFCLSVRALTYFIQFDEILHTAWGPEKLGSFC